MKLYDLRRSIDLPITINECWGFFSDPRNLALITPPSLNLRPLGEPAPSMYTGMIVTYSVRPFPLIRSTWVSEITHVEPPIRFIDEQRFGPYKFWHHTHEFAEIESGVRVIDIVRYALPFDPVSRLAQPLVARQLASIFAFRESALLKRFGGHRRV